MARQRGPIVLSEADFIEEVLKRLDGSGVTKAQARKMLTAIKDEVVDCVINGYKVNLTGLASFEPVLKPGRKKGTVVKNPFAGTEKTLRSDEPDSFALRVKKSGGVKGKFPSLRTKDGQALAEQLRPVKRTSTKKTTAKSK